MRRYVTGLDGYLEAERQAHALHLGLEIADFGKLIKDNRERLGASEHLGHLCLVWTRIAYPYEDTPELASLIAVHGVAIGPFDTITQERHPTWNRRTRATDLPIFDQHRQDCKELVRGADARVVEAWVAGGVIRDPVLPIEGPAFSLHHDLQMLTGVPDTLEPHTFIGAEAIELADQMIGSPIGHQFAHPALQEFWQQRVG